MFIPSHFDCFVLWCSLSDNMQVVFVETAKYSGHSDLCGISTTVLEPCHTRVGNVKPTVKPALQ